MREINNPESEKELEVQVIKLLIKNKWKVLKNKSGKYGQISSDEKRKNGRPLHRLDIMCYHPTLEKLNPIGIELKYVTQIRCGGKFGKHLLQILRYRDCHFKGRTIKTWVLGAYFQSREHSTVSDEYAKDAIDTTKIYTKGLMNQLGIGWLDLNKECPPIEFADNDREMKITINKPDYCAAYKTNAEKMLKFINDKRIVKVIK